MKFIKILIVSALVSSCGFKATNPKEIKEYCNDPNVVMEPEQRKEYCD